MQSFVQCQDDSTLVVNQIMYRKLPELCAFTEKEVLAVLSDACEPKCAPNPGVTHMLAQVVRRFPELPIPTSVQLTQAFMNQVNSIKTYDAASAMLEPVLSLAQACFQRYDCLLRVFAPVVAKLLQTCSNESAGRSLENSAVLRKLAHLIQLEKSLASTLAGAGPFFDRLLELCCIRPSSCSVSPQTCVAAFTVLCLLPNTTFLTTDVFRIGFMSCAVADVPMALTTHMLDVCLPCLSADALKACVRTAWSHVRHAVVLLPSTLIAYCSLFARVADVVPLSLAVPFTDPRTSLYRVCTHFEALMLAEPSVPMEWSFYQFVKQAWPLVLSENSRSRIVGALAKHAVAFAVVSGTVSLVLCARENEDISDWLYEQEFADNASPDLAVRLVHSVSSGEAGECANYMQAAAWMVQFNMQTASQLGANRDFINDVATVYTTSADVNCRARAREILEEIADDYFEGEDTGDDAADAEDVDTAPAPCSYVVEEGVTVAEASLCVVCLEKNTGPFVFLPCAHQFHVDCINSWFSTRAATCPVCKHALNPGDFFSQ
jgi:hypothetical protein